MPVVKFTLQLFYFKNVQKVYFHVGRVKMPIVEETPSYLETLLLSNYLLL